MAINLTTKSADKLTQATMRKSSVVAGKLSKNFSFKGGKSVEVLTVLTVPTSKYNRSGTQRYGAPKELQDIKQTLNMTQDTGFALTIDKGNLKDQNELKKAGETLKLQQIEQVIPEYDRYVLNVLANNAGFVMGVKGFDSSKIVKMIVDAGAVLDDDEIPDSDRTLFVRTDVYSAIKLSPEFVGLQKIGTRAITKGLVGELDNMEVVKVGKKRWPQNLLFMIVHKDSATAPKKIAEGKIHQDPPGLSGNLIEGRDYYDCFVIGVRANGIYAAVDVSTGAATICVVPTIESGTGALTTTTAGAEFYYTMDGTDPRYSDSKIMGQPSDITEGVTIRAYAYKKDCFNSPVAEKTM